MSRTIKVLDDNEVERFLACLHKDQIHVRLSSFARRDCLMVLLMLDAGLRVGEVVRLKDIDLFIMNHAVHSVKVRAEISKNKRERIIPLSERLVAAINAYSDIGWRSTNTRGSSYCFYSSDVNNHITTRQVERMVLKIGWSSCDRRITPHMLRHTFATRLIKSTSTRIVQTLLGHSSLTSTEIYTHPNDIDLKNAIDTMN